MYGLQFDMCNDLGSLTITTSKGLSAFPPQEIMTHFTFNPTLKE